MEPLGLKHTTDWGKLDLNAYIWILQANALLLKISIVVVERTLRMIRKARLRPAPVRDKVNICTVTAAGCDRANVSPPCTGWKRDKDKMRLAFPCVIPRPEGAKIWLAQLNT